MSEGIKLTEDKIKTLGRAITDKADVLFEAYSPEGCYGAVNTSSKQYKVLRDSGVISINANSITLGSSFRDILRTVDQKSYRTHTMPDVEDWKQNIHHSIQMAQAASDSFDETHDEMMHLANIRDEANMLSEALGREMANIEYIINSDLNNTPNIKAKRIILESLNKKIKSQIQKTAILGREELYKLHGDYTKAAVILDEYLSDSIVGFNHEMGVHLDKTILLIDKLKKDQNRQNKILWQLHKALRNEQFVPKHMGLELRDIESIGLAFGGIDVSDSLYNVELSDDSYLLATIMDKLASSKPITQGKDIKVYDGEYVESKEKSEQKSPSPEKLWVLKYLSNNNTDNLSRCYSVREYWQTAGLSHVVEYKAFLALVLKVCGSNFKNDHIIKKKDTCYWKLYLKKRWLSDTCDTMYITDAKYVRCHTTSTEPSENELWTPNSLSA